MRSFLIALCCLLLAPAAAQAGAPFSLGVQDDAVFLDKNPVMSPTAGLDLMSKIHANTVRINVSMAGTLATDAHSTKAPAKPTYDFSAYDTAVNAQRAAGNTVDLTVLGPVPAWAAGNKKVGSYKINATSFAAFAGAVADHFSGRIRSISILNEPNYPTSMTPVLGKCATKRVNGKKKKVCADLRPQLYRDIYLRSYAAIKKASPKTQVWLGELAPQGRNVGKNGNSIAPLAFLRGVLGLNDAMTRTSGATVKTDGLALHPYLLGKPPTAKPAGKDDLSMAVLSRASTFLTKAEKLKAIRTSQNKTGIPIYLTEFGYLTISGSRGVSTSKQASYIPTAIKMAKQASRVRSLILYELIDPHVPAATWIGGLYTRDGHAKPVVAKLAALR